MIAMKIHQQFNALAYSLKPLPKINLNYKNETKFPN